MRGQAGEQYMGVSETQKSKLCLEWQDTPRCAIAKGFTFLVGPVTSEECLHISEHHFFICKMETRTSASPQITPASPPINHFDPIVGRNGETGTHMPGGGQSGHLFLSLSLFNLTNLQSTCNVPGTITVTLQILTYSVSMVDCRMLAMIPLTAPLSWETPLPHRLGAWPWHLLWSVGQQQMWHKQRCENCLCFGVCHLLLSLEPWGHHVKKPELPDWSLRNHMPSQMTSLKTNSPANYQTCEWGHPSASSYRQTCQVIAEAGENQQSSAGLAWTKRASRPTYWLMSSVK